MATEQLICQKRTRTFDCKNPVEGESMYCIVHSSQSLTKEDVETIRERGLHFIGASFRGSHLENVIFSELKMVDADFTGAFLSNCIFKATDLWRAKFDKAEANASDFERANLMEASFRRASLKGAMFEEAFLKATNFGRARMQGALLRGAHFDNTIFEDCEWEQGKINAYERRKDWESAREVYQSLKSSCKEHGDYATAADFFYREMETRRKQGMQETALLNAIIFAASKLFWGYGEKPFRIAWTVLLMISIFSVLYWWTGAFVDKCIATSVYFSAVSFTCLGYGSWTSAPTANWVPYVGVAEAGLGIVTMALFASALFHKINQR